LGEVQEGGPRQDAREEGGALNAQWKRRGDLSSEKVLKQFGAILAAMGFSENVLQAITCFTVGFKGDFRANYSQHPIGAGAYRPV